MTATLDPRFPALHRVHPRGWINDPNGIHRTADGRWHVFFQYNPASVLHQDIHWGHMSSPDLVSWREEPLGPSPRPGGLDQDGCWSGVALLDGEGEAAVPTLVYSGVDGTENQFARVLVARLDPRGIEVVRPGTVAAEVPEVPGLIGVRDPFLFEHGGKRWGVQGAGVREEGGFVPTLLLYSCEDLERWELVGTLLHGDDPVAAEHSPADLWECPQLVEVDGRWVLLLSRWGHPSTHERQTLQVDYLVGDLVEEADGTPRFVPTAGGQVDLGPDFYAPQAVVDPDGDRVLLWGWSWEDVARTPEQTAEQGWAGVLTFPRELRLDGEELRADPAAELTALRAEPLVLGAADGGGGRGVAAADGDRGSADVDGTGGDVAVLELAAPARAEVRTRGRLVVEILGKGGEVHEVLAADDGPATLFLDASLLELLPEGAAPRTLRLYPEAEDQGRVRGALEEAWRLEVPGR
jgi:beta-fructofuranosidase